MHAGLTLLGRNLRAAPVSPFLNPLGRAGSRAACRSGRRGAAGRQRWSGGVECGGAEWRLGGGGGGGWESRCLRPRHRSEHWVRAQCLLERLLVLQGTLYKGLKTII